MSNGYLFVFLFGSCVVGTLSQEDTACIASAPQEIASCSASHMAWITEYGNTAASGNGSAIMETMCSDTGKDVIGCFFDVFEKCPALMMGSDSSDASMTSMLPFNMTEIISSGGLDVYCDLISAPCKELMQCMDKVPTGESGMAPPADFSQYMTDATAFNEAKTYLSFQHQTAMACGDKMSEQVDNIMKQTAPGIQDLKLMTFNATMTLVGIQCPLMPKDFDSSECLQQQVVSCDFTACHQKFSATYNTTTERNNCKAFEALEGCFNKNVKPKCGAATSSFMTRNTPLIVDGLSSSCVKETNASSKPLATPIIVIMAALFVSITTLL